VSFSLNEKISLNEFTNRTSLQIETGSTMLWRTKEKSSLRVKPELRNTKRRQKIEDVSFHPQPLFFNYPSHSAFCELI
jgi:hypothetical protein